MKRINRISNEKKEEKQELFSDIIDNFKEIILGQDIYIGELLDEITKLNNKNDKIKKQNKKTKTKNIGTSTIN